MFKDLGTLTGSSFAGRARARASAHRYEMVAVARIRQLCTCKLRDEPIPRL